MDEPQWENLEDIEVNEQQETEAPEENIEKSFSEKKKTWNETSILEKVSEHKSVYVKTGVINFSPLEVVARMAAEGPVFLPCEAQEIIAELTKATDGIKNSTRQLLWRLETENTQKLAIREELVTLNQWIQKFTSQVNYLLPRLSDFVETEKYQEYLSNLSELKYASSYLIEYLNSDIESNQESRQRALERSKGYLISLNRNAVFLKELTQKIIYERVPLYMGGDLNE